MKYAIYWQPDLLTHDDETIECFFYKTLEDAKAAVGELIAKCEAAWEENPEQNCPTMDITLMAIIGEVHDTPNGIQLRMK